MTETRPSTIIRRAGPVSVLLTAAGIVVSSATLVGFLGRFSWFLDLFSHFRVQYTLGLCILGLLLFLGRRRRTATTFLAFSCINLFLVLPLYFGTGNPVPECAQTFRAMLLNVNTHRGDPHQVEGAILEIDPDILVLEEISARWVRDLAWITNSLPYSCIEPREDNFGIGLFSRFPLAESEVVYVGEAGVPSIMATIEAGIDKIGVVATHPLPPGGASYSRRRNSQLEALPDYVCSTQPLILLGDLNVTPWNYQFRRLLRRTGLIDSSKGFGFQPTWP